MREPFKPTSSIQLFLWLRSQVKDHTLPMQNFDLFVVQVLVFPNMLILLCLEKLQQAKYVLMVMPHTKQGSLNEGNKTESLSSEFHKAQLVNSSTNMATLIKYATNTQVSSLVTHVQIRGDFPNGFTLYSPSQCWD